MGHQRRAGSADCPHRGTDVPNQLVPLDVSPQSCYATVRYTHSLLFTDGEPRQSQCADVDAARRRELSELGELL
jgi:hypothetical protein